MITSGVQNDRIPVERSNSDRLMMQSAQDWQGQDVTDPLDVAWKRCVLLATGAHELGCNVVCASSADGYANHQTIDLAESTGVSQILRSVFFALQRVLESSNCLSLRLGIEGEPAPRSTRLLRVMSSSSPSSYQRSRATPFHGSFATLAQPQTHTCMWARTRSRSTVERVPSRMARPWSMTR